MNKLIRTVAFALLVFFTACETKPDTSKAKKIAFYFEKINAPTTPALDRGSYLDTLGDYLTFQANDSANRNLQFKIAREYFKLNKNKAYLRSVLTLNKLALAENDTAHIAKSFCYIGDYYENDTQIDSAFKYYLKAEHLFKSINDSLNLGRLILYKAGILYDAGIYTESEIETAKALQILVAYQNDRLIYEGYNLMGLNAKELNNFSTALNYFNLALMQLAKMESNNYSVSKLSNSRSTIYNNIGGTYVKDHKYLEAVTFYEKALLNSELKRSSPELNAMFISNLAYAKMKLGELRTVEQLFIQSKNIRDGLQLKSGIITSHLQLGEYYLVTNDTLKGIAYLEEGYKKAKELKCVHDLKNALYLLSLHHKTKGDYYGQQYIAVNDSLLNIERNTRNKFARIAYETAQIQEKNAILIKKHTLTVLAFSSALLLIITIFIIYRLKNKNRELLLIQEQEKSTAYIYQLILEQANQNQALLDAERNRIAMELHDGIINRIFTTRYNLMHYTLSQTDKKELLVNELLLAEKEIRQVSHDLQQNSLFEDTNFQNAIGALVEQQTNSFGTTFDYCLDKQIDWAILSIDYKVHIYRISQEAFQNVNNYAQATRCSLFMLKRGTKILLQITDNGIGFDLQKNKAGLGLKNITRRALKMDGTCRITSDSNGTIIEVLFG